MRAVGVVRLRPFWALANKGLELLADFGAKYFGDRDGRGCLGA